VTAARAPRLRTTDRPCRSSSLAANTLRILTEPEQLREELSAVVEEHLGAGVRIEGLAPLVGGASRELWAFELVAGDERRAAVLRRDPVGVGDPAGRRREWEVLRAAHDHGVPVPEPLWFVESASGSAFVMERLEGEAIARRLLGDDRFAGARERLTGQLAHAAAAVHAIPVSELPATQVGERPPAEAGIAALEAELDRIGEPHPALELGLRWLWRNLPEPVEPALVHGDFRTGNFMVDERGLVGVLDWLCIRSWRHGADTNPAGGFGSREELLAAYAAAGGRAVTPEQLRFWEVFGNVRWGVICLVQADVHLSGRQQSLERAAIGRRTCEPEWDLLAMVGEPH
jgi:aminoglycoside phosphotransferase (APT) family kinase protein